MADESLSIEISARDLTGQAFADVKRQLEALNQASAQTAKGIGELSAGAEKFGDFLKGTGIGAALGKVISELTKFHAETRKASAAIVDQAAELGITTDQYQAYAFAADQVGVRQEVMSATLSRFTVKLGEAASGNKAAIQDFDRLGVKILDSSGRLRDQNAILAEVARALMAMGSGAEQAAAAKNILGMSASRLLPLLQQVAQGIGELDRQSKAAGTTISGSTVDAANKLENQSKQTSVALRAFYAEIGMPIELKFLKAVETVVGGIAENYRRSNLQQREFANRQALETADRRESGLQGKIDNLDRSLTSPAPWTSQATLDRLREARAELQKQIDAVREARKSIPQAGTATIEGMIPPPSFLPSVTSQDFGGNKNPDIPKISGGGGGGGTRDRIQEAINQLVGQRQAAEEALQRMMAGAGIPLKDLEQQVALEKKIADELAKLGRYDPKDPRVQQIRDQVTAHEQAESALKRWTAAARDAEEIERRSGDGTAYLRGEMQRLNEALDTGRLSYEAYGEAARVAREKAEDQRLQVKGQQGGVEGMLAGMEYAANQWSRSNSAFNLGQKAMTDGFDLLRRTGDEWAASGVVNFEKFKQAGLNMILQLGLAFAQSELMKWIKGGTGAGGGGGIFDGILNLFGGGGGGVSAVGGGFDIDAASSLAGGFMPGFAGGGETPVNRPFWVGENGKELMQLGTPARVYNQDQIAGMGGDPTVIVQQTVHVGEYVTSTEFRRGLGAVKDAAQQGAIAAFLDDRRRGGKSKRVFG